MTLGAAATGGTNAALAQTKGNGAGGIAALLLSACSLSRDRGDAARLIAAGCKSMRPGSDTGVAKSVSAGGWMVADAVASGGPATAAQGCAKACSDGVGAGTSVDCGDAAAAIRKRVTTSPVSGSGLAPATVRRASAGIAAGAPGGVNWASSSATCSRVGAGGALYGRKSGGSGWSSMSAAVATTGAAGVGRRMATLAAAVSGASGNTSIAGASAAAKSDAVRRRRDA